MTSPSEDRTTASAPPPAEPTGAGHTGDSNAVTAARARSRTPRPPSAKQRAFFRSVLASEVFSDEERAKYEDWLTSKATMKTCSDLLDWMKVEKFRRGGTPKAPPIHEL